MNIENYEMICRLRHELHAHPELSMHENETKKRLMDFLKENTCLEIVDRGLWFYACYHAPDPISDIRAEAGFPDPLSVDAESGRSPIAFRAEFDAIPVNETLDLPYRSCVPGVSHKCGHDGHASILAGLALEINDRVKSAGSCQTANVPMMSADSHRDEESCTNLPDRDIYFIFQHAEETGQGGEPCSALIREKGITEVYACHNMSGWPKGSIVLRDGTMWCASKGLRIHFEGKASHASLPEDGISPVIPISQLASYAAAPVPEGRYERMVLSTVVGVRVGNEDFGVSPGEGTLSLTLRGELEDEMLDREMDLRNRACYLASAYTPEGQPPMKVTFSETDVFPETRNDAACADKVRSAAARLGLTVIDLPDPVRSSEDFGWFTKACPGASFLLGTGEDYPAIHTPEFDYPDDLMPEVVDLFLALIR